jgi:uncharacterized protein
MDINSPWLDVPGPYKVVAAPRRNPMNRKSANKNHERRIVSRESAEIRVEGDADSGRKLVGKAVPYNTWSEEHFGFGGKFRERILSGAFDLEDRDILVTVEHDNGALLGRTASGTARLEERKDGLYYSVDLPDTTAGRDVAELVERGDIRGNSFEFIATADDWDEEDRTISKGMLFQVGPVASPFYDADTTVALRSKQAAAEVREEDETELLSILLDIEEASGLPLES